MKRKALKISGGVVLLFFLLLGLSVYNFISNKRIMESAELTGEFVTDTIPFQMAPSGHILIKARINGSDQSYPFILDSGASNLIFSNHSSEFELQEKGSSLGFGSNGSYFSASVHRLDQIQIGDLEFRNIGLEEVDFNFSCMDYVYGIVGIGIMRHLIWQIDFEKEIIIVSTKLEDLHFGKEKVVFPLSENRFSHHLKLPVKLSEKEKSIEVFLDLGSNTNLSLKQSHLSESAVQPPFKKIQGKSSEGLGDTEGATANSTYYLLDSLRLGRSGFHLNRVPVYVNPRNMNLLGLGVLKNYKTTISWKDRKLILEPYLKPPSFIWKSAGFAMNFTDKAVVVAVIDNSAADKLGLKVGAEVLSINGNIVKRDNFCSLKNSPEYKDSDTLNFRVRQLGKIFDHQLVKEPIF